MPNKLLNKRQEHILGVLEASPRALAVSGILKMLKVEFADAARITIIRDLKQLVGLKLAIKTGYGRGVTYSLSPNYNAVKPVNIEAYFKIDPDQREIIKRFNLNIFSLLQHGIFDQLELSSLQKFNQIYSGNAKRLSPVALKKELERLAIELSWKSSKIEGNTYTLLETEYLIKEQKEPKGHTKEETAMIVNHKKALDYIYRHKGQFKKMSVAKIEDVHSLLTKDLGVARNLRTRLVRVSGTAYAPLDNKFQVREAMVKTCRMINALQNPFDKAIAAMLLIAYIQPFEDGNKRTSRLIGNAILMAHNCCPLSYRSIDELEYKKAVILFYEQNNLRYFKEIFINQFNFAVNNYFGA